MGLKNWSLWLVRNDNQCFGLAIDGSVQACVKKQWEKQSDIEIKSHMKVSPPLKYYDFAGSSCKCEGTNSRPRTIYQDNSLWFNPTKRTHHQLTVQCLLAVQASADGVHRRGLSRNQRSKPRFRRFKNLWYPVLFHNDPYCSTPKYSLLLWENDIAKGEA